MKNPTESGTYLVQVQTATGKEMHTAYFDLKTGWDIGPWKPNGRKIIGFQELPETLS